MGLMEEKGGRKRNTIADFWRMVAQEGSDTILMLCQPFESYRVSLAKPALFLHHLLRVPWLTDQVLRLLAAGQRGAHASGRPHRAPHRRAQLAPLHAPLLWPQVG